MTITTIEEFKANYKPLDEYTILAKKSTESGKFIACVFKKGIIQARYSREPYEASVCNIAEANMDKFLKLLGPYIKLRNECT